MKILLVEDESSIAESITFSCKKQNFEVVWSQNGNDALLAFENQKFDLIILDLGLPDINGLEICKIVRSKSNVSIIILTAQDSETDKVVGLELGADDYIVKPFSSRELIARIKAVGRRNPLISTNSDLNSDSKNNDSKNNVDSTKSLHKSWTHNNNRALISYKGSALILSKYEYNLLLALLACPGKIFSRSELMDRAWEVPDMSMERTVDSHIKSIRFKLRGVTDDEIIFTHRGFGYSIVE